jgi:hypothetical protein
MATGTRAATGTYGMTFAHSNLNIGNAQVTAYGGINGIVGAETASATVVAVAPAVSPLRT